jgi:tetratricopeptide (TPR) repeat protein
MQRSKIQTRQQTAGGFKIDILRRKGSFLVPFLVVFLAFSFVARLEAAEKKPRKVQPKPSAVAKDSTSSEWSISARFQKAEERLRKGEISEALKLYYSVYAHSKTTLAAMECVKDAYAKLGNDAELSQTEKEEIFIKLQRMGSLGPQYTRYHMESAYHLGFIYAKQGDNEQARKYLLEACQTAPPSLDPSSTWMKAKTLLLERLNVQGEF